MLTGLLVGRFQPLHLGHIETIKFTFNTVQTLIIVVGSAQLSHELRNPFTAGERIEMIRNSLLQVKEIDMRRIIIIPVPDTNIHALWTYNLDLLVPKYDIVFTNDPFTYGLFQERQKKIIIPKLYDRQKFSATLIRNYIIKNTNWKKLVHPETAKVIEEIKGIERLKMIWKKYKEKKY